MWRSTRHLLQHRMMTQSSTEVNILSFFKMKNRHTGSRISKNNEEIQTTVWFSNCRQPINCHLRIFRRYYFVQLFFLSLSNITWKQIPQYYSVELETSNTRGNSTIWSYIKYFCTKSLNEQTKQFCSGKGRIFVHVTDTLQSF